MIQDSTARSALRLLGQPRWARALLGVLALSVAFTLLGRWQLHRHEAKVARAQRVDASYSAAAVGLGELLPGVTTALPPADEWRPVRVAGAYESARTVLVRNRPLDGVFGYEVIVPLRLASGVLLLVDRGWIPNGQTGAAPDSVPAPPPGEVEVVARLRPSEPGVDRTPPAGQQLRIDIPRISVTLDSPTYRAYAVLASETPLQAARAPSAPTLLPAPDLDLGPHLAYAVQWWGFAVAAYGVLGYYLMREARDGVGPASRRPSGAGPVDGAGGTPEVLATAGTRGRRGSGRREPSDEEWEDGADG